MIDDDYQAGLDYLFGRLDYERLGMPRASTELRLGRMRRLLRRLGDPQDALKIVHLAGTKGKGSTSAMIASVLSAAGLRAGLCCSPHLHRLEERFQVDGQDATPEELVGLVETVRPIVEELDAHDPHPRERALTFFEVTTAMALLHFARKKAGAVVLEVGLGGRLDSTNVVRSLLAVLTSISFDHTRLLGSTLGQIAFEKAGILKRGCPAVSGVRGVEARAAIQRVAQQRRCKLHELDVDYTYDYLPPVPPIVRPTRGQVAVKTWRSDWGVLNVPLYGEHQAHNVAVALAALDALAEIDSCLAVSRETVARGLAEMRWPARVEVVAERPWTVIDGAHNVASAEALAEALTTCFPAVPRTLVFGTSRDKDLLGQLRALVPLFDVIVATRYVKNPRAVPPETIAEAVLGISGQVAQVAPDPASALAEAGRLTPSDGLICVAGSLFLAAEARAIPLHLGIDHAEAQPTI